MCGIIGYIGKENACQHLFNGLERLEYRGYDSAGVALLNGTLRGYKKAGKLQILKDHLAEQNVQGNSGIGHTRWATHGEANDINAHPHFSNDGKLALIHNGIIENFQSLKSELIDRGHQFYSTTDSEVLMRLIEEIHQNNSYTLEQSVQQALKKVVGAYAIIVVSQDEPEKLVAARKSSPLAVGIGEGEFFIASDSLAFSPHIKKVLYLEDEDVVICNSHQDVRLTTVANEDRTPFIQDLEISLDNWEKGEYKHFMLKEIFEQPATLYDTIRGRLKKNIRLSGIEENLDVFKKCQRIVIIGCGTSWHAALIAKYYFEDLVKIPVQVEYASEFRYRKPVIMPSDIVIAVSQSGETADTMAAMELVREQKVFTYGICNVAGSSIARFVDAGTYTHVGTEVGVASTKAFTSQVLVFMMMALRLAELRNSTPLPVLRELRDELKSLPHLVSEALLGNQMTELMARAYKESTNFLYLGRNENFPAALEGALKLKEISYIHAEGYPAAEMKHGPIALIDEQMPVVVIANNRTHQGKLISNVEEIKSRGANVLAVVNSEEKEVFQKADVVLEVPKTSDYLAPIVASIPLQLLAYHIADIRGCEVDQPRNLAKSVTVE